MQMHSNNIDGRLTVRGEKVLQADDTDGPATPRPTFKFLSDTAAESNRSAGGRRRTARLLSAPFLATLLIGPVLLYGAASFAAAPAVNLVVTAESPQVHLTGTFRAINGYLARSPRVLRAASPRDQARVSPTLPHGGFYELFAWWPQGVAGAGPIRITVRDARGLTTVFANQSVSAGQWNAIGLFQAQAKGRISVTLEGQDGGALVMDALRFFYRGTQAPALDIQPDALPAATVGMEYEAMLSAGGRPPFIWSLSKGRLPQGLTLDTQTGQLIGTPEETGTFEAELQVLDAGGQRAAKTLSLLVGDPGEAD